MPPKKNSKKKAKPKVSWVWRHFDKTNAFQAKCRLCFKTYGSSGNTTNLSKHLNNAHFIHEPTGPTPPATAQTSSGTNNNENNDIIDVDATASSEPGPSQAQSLTTNGAQPQKRTSEETPNMSPKRGKSSSPSTDSLDKSRIDSYYDNWNSLKQGGLKYVRIVNAILFWIVKDMLPFRSVEKEGFRFLMKTVVPGFEVPCRNTIKLLLVKKYESLLEIMKGKFKKISFFTLTSDIWTETKNSMSFISLTAHFIEDGIIRALPLGVEPLTERHEGPYIAAVLDKILKLWGITNEKIVAMMTDNGANMVNGATELVGRSKFIPCFAHTLQLVPEAIFKDEAVDAMIKKVKSIVTLFKQSVVAADLLRKAQKTTPLKLIQSCETRWNSVYYMIERILELLPAVNDVLLSFPHIAAISGAEAEILREILSVLKHFAYVTTEMSGELYACGSRIIPALRVLRIHLGRLKLKTDIGKTVLDLALKNLDKRFAKIEEVRLLAIATILDPRFKSKHFINGGALAGALNKINSLMRELKTAAEKENAKKKVATTNEKTAEKPHEFWGPHDELIESQERASDPQGSEYFPELTQYLALSCEKREIDPVKYWMDQKKAMPLLSQVALKHLIIVGTSVPSERTFSKAGEHYTRDRNRLHGSLLGKMLFLQALPFRDWFLN